MNEQTKSLGQLLQMKREERQISLKDVESATSIRMGYLQAIEEGSISKYISGIYALGFIRQYANFLGLSIDELSAAYPEAFKANKEKHEFSYGIGTLEVRNTSGSGSKWLPNLLWVSGSITLLMGIWYLIRYLGII